MVYKRQLWLDSCRGTGVQPDSTLATVEVTLTPADAFGYFRLIVKKQTVLCLLLLGDLTKVKAEMLCPLLSRDLATSFDRVVCRQLLLTNWQRGLLVGN